jgi:hypothetical protein
MYNFGTRLVFVVNLCYFVWFCRYIGVVCGLDLMSKGQFGSVYNSELCVKVHNVEFLV